MNRIQNLVTEFDGKGKVLSALLSVLTLFAMLGNIVPELYGKLPAYAELICGITTWSGYNKQADLYLIQMVLLGLPCLFAVFAFVYMAWKRFWRSRGEGCGTVWTVTYVAVLCLFFVKNRYAVVYLMIWMVLFAGYHIAARRNQTGRFVPALMLALVTGYTAVAGILCLSCFAPAVGSIWQKYADVFPVIVAVLFFAFLLLPIDEKKYDLLLWIQIFMPVAWLGFVHFRYRYETDGALMELFYSGRWKWCCVLLCLAMILLCVLEKKKTGSKISVSTFAMLAVMRCYSLPEGMLSIDFFHNGEISMPMQQFVSYGKLPYLDFIPIHGFCDYYYGIINYLFFDGSYMALNAAKTVGDLFAAIFLAVLLWFFVGNRYQGLFLSYFFVPYLVKTAGMRYWLLVTVFLVLFSYKAKKGMQSLYAWVLCSVLAIAWNPSIGGAAAIAFLPVVFYRCRRDLPGQLRELWFARQKRRRNLTCVAWLLLFGAGVAFIPLFLQIVGYLKENTGTTVYANGMEMFSEVSEAAAYLVPGLVNEKGLFFITAFAFVIPLLVSFMYLWQKKRDGAGEVFVTYLIAYLVLINYAFVRYDEGLRAGVLGVVFLVIAAVGFLYDKVKTGEKDARFLYTAFISLAVMLSGIAPSMNADTPVAEREIPAYVDTMIMGQKVQDPVVYVSGDSVNMPNLGTGFIQGNTLNGLQNIQTVVSAATGQGKTVFDITNAVANAVIYDLPSYLPYSSAYNISNRMMQDKAIALLQQQLPDVILAAPEIRFDDAPFSYRSMKLYRYLMTKDYVPYKYENVIYLVRGDNPVQGASQDTEAFAQLMHKKYLAYLPAVYGANLVNGLSDEIFAETAVDYKVECTENGFAVEFPEPLKGSEVAAIGISGLAVKETGNEAENTLEQEMTVTMEINSSISSTKTAEFEFALKGDAYFLPVCCSPYFTEENEIHRLEFKTEAIEQIIRDDIKIQIYQ